VQSEGWGYQIKRELLNLECERGGSMRSVLLLYTQAYVTQVAQIAVCNRQVVPVVAHVFGSPGIE